MAHNFSFDLSGPVGTGGDSERDPTGDAQAAPAATAEPQLPEEWDGERDLGSLNLPDEYGEWQDDFADAVCVSRWREL